MPQEGSTCGIAYKQTNRKKNTRTQVTLAELTRLGKVRSS